MPPKDQRRGTMRVTISGRVCPEERESDGVEETATEAVSSPQGGWEEKKDLCFLQFKSPGKREQKGETNPRTKLQPPKKKIKFGTTLADQ